ncbi:MAG TPA: tetratricopeptide repeat protein [Rhizomicrobium sp.]
MSDIFREVEEDVRRDKLQKFWKAYGDYVIALVAVIIVGIAGFELWQRYQATQRDKASVAFSAAQAIRDPKQAAESFADLAKTAPKGYALLAKLEQASSMMASGERDGAIALYREVVDQDKGGIGAVARLREAWALADTSSRSDLETLLAPLRTGGAVWKPSADEILAYSDYHNNQIAKAAAEFEALAKDPNSPQQLQRRSQAMAFFLKQGGAKDFGTVPPPTPTIAPGAVVPATPAPAAPAKP